MNKNEVGSLLIEAQYLLEMLFLDDACCISRKKLDASIVQIAALQIVQRARQIHCGHDPSPLDNETLELIAKLEMDAAIDNAKYASKMKLR